MLALVTGGHGFIGSHLVRRLLEDGHRVRVLARPGSRLDRLEGLPVEVARADLAVDAGLEAAVAGADWVFHLAGALKGFREADLLRVNRDGTRRLAAACRAGAPGLARFLLVSSLAAGGPSPGGGRPRTEDDPPAPVSWYGRSKLEGERAAMASGLPVVILRPPVVFGPEDRDVLGYFRLAKRGLLPVPGPGSRRYSLVYAPDLADGLVRAAQAPCAAGNLFHLTGPDLDWADFGRRIAGALGRPARVLALPEGLVRACGLGADLWARLRGRPGIFSSQKVREMLAPGWVASPDKARRVLGWTAPTDLDRALQETVRWYQDHGWL
jgi:nucleoside-diphosphate-sugar epimerase